MQRWGRWVVGILLCIAVTIGLALGPVYWSRSKSRQELDAAIADLDQSDPGWRLDEIQANRQKIPDADNGVLVALAAHKLLPPNWPGKIDLDFEFAPPCVKLSSTAAKGIRDELLAQAKAVEQARKLSAYPAGRFAIEFKPDFMSTNLKDQQNGRIVGTLLSFDFMDSIETNDQTRAAQSIVAMVNLGRCYDGDPLLIFQLIRVAIISQALRSTERALGNENFDEATLAKLQAIFTEEAAAELFLAGMRGERALMHLNFKQLAENNTTAQAALRDAAAPSSPWDFLFAINLPTVVNRSNVWLMRFNTEVLNALKHPGRKRYAELQRIRNQLDESKRDFDKDTILGKLVAGTSLICAESERRTDTLLGCAIAGLAAERFRLKNDRWPKSLDELVAEKFLANVPDDLYSDQPLRLRHVVDGLVIYSVGKEGKYAGDRLDQLAPENFEDVRWEFRLWNPDRRRQPPLPPKKIDPQPEE
jgi:hypothetical protein